MMDKETILLLCTLIGCAVGIGGFVAGVISRAKQDGKLSAQIEFCVTGISSINNKMEAIQTTVTKAVTDNARYEERIKSLEEHIKSLEGAMKILQQRKGCSDRQD